MKRVPTTIEHDRAIEWERKLAMLEDEILAFGVPNPTPDEWLNLRAAIKIAYRSASRILAGEQEARRRRISG